MDNAKKIHIEPREVLRIGGILMAICASVALVLSFVNMVTRDKIAQNNEAEKRNAIVALFEEGIEYTELEGAPETVNGVYKVTLGEETLGYCISVSPSGFGGNIDMMVALDGTSTVLGVKIVSLSETPGLGSRVAEEAFLSAFEGKGSGITLGDIDAISGSTISSRAVLSGVNAATAALTEYLGGGVSN